MTNGIEGGLSRGILMREMEKFLTPGIIGTKHSSAKLVLNTASLLKAAGQIVSE